MGYDISVGLPATVPDPTHHIRMYEGSDELGIILCDSRGNPDPTAFKPETNPRLSLQMRQGRTKWWDYSPPWTPEGQENWEKGRGAKYFSDDENRYSDGYSINATRKGEIILGPQTVYTEGIFDKTYFWPTNDISDGKEVLTSYTHTNNIKYSAIKFTAARTETIKYLKLILMYKGSPSNLACKIVDDDGTGNAPDITSVLDELTHIRTDIGNDNCAKTIEKTFSAGASVTATNDYWLVIYNTTSDASNYWAIGTSGSSGQTISAAYSSDGATWHGYGTSGINYVLTPAKTPAKIYMVDLKGVTYAVIAYDDGSTCAVLRNGHHGVATAGTTTTLTATGTPFVASEHKGAIVKFIAGAGCAQPIAFAQISDNTDAILTFDEVDVAPGSDTVYGIVAKDGWTDVTWGSMPADKRVTDVYCVNNVLYICFGQDDNMIGLQVYDNAGTWTETWHTDGTNKFDYIYQVPGHDKTMKIWGANRVASTIDVAPAQDGSAASAVGNLVFVGTAIQVGSTGDKIVGLDSYGTRKNLIVLKESGLIYEVYYNWDATDYVVSELPLSEIKNLKDYRNGIAHGAMGPYFFWGQREGFLRWYESRLDAMGPNRDEGMPDDRRGYPAFWLPYAEGIGFLAYNGGKDNYSTVLAYNGQGWHEIYRAPIVGDQIRYMYIEPIPGDHVDRLYISCGSDVIWLSVDPNPYNTVSVTYNFYKYTRYGALETSLFEYGLIQEEKYFNSIQLLLDKPTGASLYMSKYTGDELNPTYNYIGSGAIDGLNTFTIDETGTFLKLMYGLRSDYNNVTPRIKSTVLEGITRIEYKRITTINFRLTNKDTDLQGNEEPVILATKWTQLETWAGQAGPINLDAVTYMLDGKEVFLNQGSVRLKNIIYDEDGIETLICQAQLVEM